MPIRPLRTQLAANPAIGRAALLGAVLEDPVVFLENLAAEQVLLDADAQGLFDVAVFPRASCHDGDRHVPVVGRGDDHGVDVVDVRANSRKSA